MELTVIFSDKYRVAVVSKNGECEVTDFLRNVEKTYKAHSDGLFAVLEKVSKEGLDQLPDSLSRLVDNKEKIREFRRGKLRLFYFNGHGDLLVVCTSALIKKTQKVDKSHIDKAKKLKTQYFKSDKEGTLELIEDNQDET